MVEQRPSKPHVWVRFLLSLLMLFKKPSIFVFKQKLNISNSTQTTYIRNFKFKNFNNINQINSVLNKLNETDLNSFNQNLQKKIIFFRKILFHKWNVSKHFKMKFFSRSLVSTNTSSINTRILKPSSFFSFSWQSQKIHPLHTNVIRNSQVSTINLMNSYAYASTAVVGMQVHQKFFWFSLLANSYQLVNLLTNNTTFFKQLHKYFYINHNITQLNSINFFNTNRVSLNIPNLLSVSPFQLSNSFKNTNISSKSLNTTCLLIILSKYLPHINLVRLFRRTRNKKTLHYNIDKNSFFKSPLLRINLDYKFYGLNTLKIAQTKTIKRDKLSLFIRLLSRDNLLETKWDSLVKVSNFTSIYTPFLENHQINKEWSQSVKGTPSNWLVQFSNPNLLLLDFINIKTIVNNPLLYKYLFWLITPQINANHLFNYALTSLNDHSFSTRLNFFKNSNLWPSSFFHFTLKRKILKIFSFNKFLPNVTMWYYNILIRFMESCTGKKIFLKFNPFIENFLSFTDIARCNMWSIRINSFQKLLGPKIFLNESLRIMHIALRFKDPTFFANWIKGMLNRMSFWKYRLLFRYIKFAMRYLFWLYFSDLQFKGLKIKLKGKISVAGNARTRTLVYRIGETGYSKIDNRVLCDSSIINTFTGVLGFKIWFFF